MNEERIREVFADEEFVKELCSKETPEEAQALLAEKDIDVSVEDLAKIKDLIVKKAQAIENGESAELIEEDLEDVAGGSVGIVFAFIGRVIAAEALLLGGSYAYFKKVRW